jgi:hypothetical protein
VVAGMGQWWSDPDTNIALSRQLEIELFVLKAGFAPEWLRCT